MGSDTPEDHDHGAASWTGSGSSVDQRDPAGAASSDPGARPLTAAGSRALRAGVLGNFVDQVHIFLPLVALAPALGVLAGPHTSLATGSVVVMAMLLGRPIGGMVFGQVADRLGRTRTTRIAITGTALCSLGIAAMPTHTTIGAAAMVGVLVLRLLGGIFIAGEYSAAIPLAMEWASPPRRGLVSGLIMSMAPWAQAGIAFGTAALLVVLGPAQYAAWGWRIGFLLGGLASLAMLAWYRRVDDAVLPAPAERTGLSEVMFGRHRGSFWMLYTLMSGLWLLTQMTVIWLAQRLGPDTGLGVGTAATTMGMAAIGQAVVMACTGQLSTMIGRRTFFVVWGILATVSGPMLWSLIMSARSPWQIALACVGIQVLTVTAYGPVGAFLCEGFPAAVRSTGYGTAYSLSIVAPALYPYYLPGLQRVFGHDGAVLVLLALGGLLVTIAGMLARPQKEGSRGGSEAEVCDVLG